MAVVHPGVRLWLAAFVFISDSRAAYIDVEEWQGRCVYDGRKGFGRGATCRAASHGAWRGDTRKSSTKQGVQWGLVEGAKNSGGKRGRRTWDELRTMGKLFSLGNRKARALSECPVIKTPIWKIDQTFAASRSASLIKLVLCESRGAANGKLGKPGKPDIQPGKAWR